MPVFTAVAAAVSAAVGGGLFGAVAGFAARTLLTVGITKLVANKAGKTAAGTQDAGSRVQLPPASNNKLPVVYGTAYMAPIVTDAKISDNQKTMWYVCTLAEVTDTGSYTFGDIYWAGKKCIFDGSDTGKVIQLETNSDPVQLDDTINGKIWIYRFPNGSASGIDTGASNAITLLSDSEIPADLRWNSALYTSGGQSASMTNTAFVVVKVIYDANANTQRLEALNVELTNSLNKPGDVIYDYMTNSRYGCGINSSDIDSTSITTLNTYSDELITYIPVGGGSATQPRYRINGPVNTGQNCLNNLQELVDTCDTWLQYSELSGKWTMVVNKPYDWDGTTLGDLYQVTDYNLISGINVNPIDLNSAYNQLEVQFPDQAVKDQTNYNILKLIDFAPEVMSPNEPENQLIVQFPQVNNYIQASYLGIRRLLQSREDLVIDFTLDYSGIQVVAGDVICIPFEPYGWEIFNSGYGKLFRVSQVQEAKLEDGSLGARITAFEYNATIYADDPIQNYVAEANTGLTDPNIISSPGTPAVTTNPLSNGNVKSFKIEATVPTSGSVLYMDFNYGYTSNVDTHVLYKTVTNGDGSPFTANQTVRIDVNDAPPGTYYISVTARNNNGGKAGPSSSPYVWAGPGVTVYDPIANAGGIYGNNVNGNIDLTGNILYSGANFTFSNVSNLHIPGGTYAFYLQTDGAGNLSWGSGGNGTDNPGGANRAIQFNDEGNLGGVANFTWDKDTEIMRVPVIQLSNGAEKITTLESNGNLYLSGWQSPSNMGGISLFQGVYINHNEPNLAPGLSGNVTIDITNIPNFSATTSNAYTTTDTNVANRRTSLTNPIYYNGNYIIASVTETSSFYNYANGIYVSNTGLNWTRVANVPNIAPANVQGAVPLVYAMATDGSNIVMASTYRTFKSTGNLSSWTIQNTSPWANSIYDSSSHKITYANNIFLATYIDYPANVLVARTSYDGGNSFGNSVSVSPAWGGSSGLPNQWVFVSNNTFVIGTISYGGANSRYISYSSDGINWNHNDLPSYYANSDTANNYPRLNNIWAGNNVVGAVVIDQNGSNISQAHSYKAITYDFGNTWSISNLTTNDTNALFVSNVSGTTKNIINYQDDRLLSLYKSNANPNSTTVITYATNNGIDWTFSGNLTVANSVQTNKSLATGINGKLMLANSYVNPNLVSNIQHAIANIPAIATYYSNGAYNSVVQDATYQSLGGSQNGNNTLFIKIN